MTEKASAASEQDVAAHYDTGAILDRIRGGLVAAGLDPAAPATADLKGVDEFHVGGIEATEALLAPLGIAPQTRVLDVGSGIGGTGRFVAEHFGAHVTGLDLTPAFVAAATALSDMVGLGARTAFRVGSALNMPFPGESFDLAVMLHVGMNIDDKPALFREVARVLARGGRFAVYDLMQRGAGEVVFPVPWASGAATSFVAPPEVYRAAARDAGLSPESERDRHAYAVDFFARVQAATARNGPPPVGLHLIMGPEARTKYANVAEAVRQGSIGPVEMVFARPG